MRIKVTHPRVLQDGKAGSGKLYQKGQHTISDAVAEHWFTKELLKSGDIAMLVEEKAEDKADANEAAAQAKADADAKAKPEKSGKGK